MARRPGIIDGARDPRRQEYLLALGEFVDEFASLEMLLHHSFRTFARINSDIAMALKGAMRLSELVPLIKRSMKARKWSNEDQAEMHTLFAQLDHISIFRDRVLHRGAWMDTEGRLHSHNIATMKSAQSAEFVEFAVTDIQNASKDLKQIRQRLALIVWGRSFKKFGPELVQAVRRPWLYKPVKLETLEQRVRTELQARGRRPKSSREK
jgi:hypothetical protein